MSVEGRHPFLFQAIGAVVSPPPSASLWKPRVSNAVERSGGRAPMTDSRWKRNPAEHVGCPRIRNNLSVPAPEMSANVCYYIAQPMVVKTVRCASFLVDQQEDTARRQ